MSEAAEKPVNGATRLAHRARDRVKRMPGGHTIWKVGVAFVGLVIVVVGIALLPLPGPGWLIIFLGLGVWATEFAWAHHLLTKAKAFVMEWTSWTLRQPLWVRGLIGLGCLVFVGALAAFGWWYVHR